LRLPRNQLVFLIVLVLLIRIIYILFFTGSNTFHNNDEPGYALLALNILKGKGFVIREPAMLVFEEKPSSMREPLYPLFLAACYKIFGHNIFLVKILQAGIDCITAIFIVLSIKKFFRFWFNLGYKKPSSIKSYMVASLNFILIILSVIALLKNPVVLKKGFPIILLIFYFTLFHMIVVAGIHYMIPIAPFLIILSSGGLFYIYKKNFPNNIALTI